MFKKVAYSILVTTLFACEPQKQSTMSTSTGAAKADEWISLFDGKSTSGWHSYGKTSVGSAWKISDGALHLDAAAKKDQKAVGGDLVTDRYTF